MLLFLGGALWSLLIDRWWVALACVIGFIIAALVIRRVSAVESEHETSSGDHIVFL
jgi:hypothetical protein